MKLKLTFFLAVLLLNAAALHAQEIPAEFFNGIKNISSDRVQAKKDMLATIGKLPAFHGAYHFLGVIYSENQQMDSAVYYLEKAVSLNTGNVNHTAEMSWVRLIESHTLKLDFAKAYQTGLDAYNLYPENREIAMQLRDACLWAFYIKHTGMDKKYLSTTILPEYSVNSISEEYLITRKLMLNGERLRTLGQSLQSDKKANYDVFKYVTTKDKTERYLKFKINWNMDTEFGGKPAPTAKVIANKANPVYERLGAVLAENERVDLKAEIARLNE